MRNKRNHPIQIHLQNGKLSGGSYHKWLKLLCSWKKEGGCLKRESGNGDNAEDGQAHDNDNRRLGEPGLSEFKNHGTGPRVRTVGGGGSGKGGQEEPG